MAPQLVSTLTKYLSQQIEDLAPKLLTTVTDKVSEIQTEFRDKVGAIASDLNFAFHDELKKHDGEMNSKIQALSDEMRALFPTAGAAAKTIPQLESELARLEDTIHVISCRIDSDCLLRADREQEATFIRDSVATFVNDLGEDVGKNFDEYNRVIDELRDHVNANFRAWIRLEEALPALQKAMGPNIDEYNRSIDEMRDHIYVTDGARAPPETCYRAHSSHS